MKPANLVVIMSDEHDPRWMGCSGNNLVQTPNLDRLAARGTRFTDAYTTCPICVPARAAFAIGKYIHQIGFWDNADPYDGSVKSWHHRLREAGHRVVSVGKLHFRSTDDDNGFSEEIVPMNVFEGTFDNGEVQALGARWPVTGTSATQGQRVKYGIRPEHLQSGGAGIAAEVVVVEPMGAQTELLVKVQEHSFTVVTRGRSRAGPGDRVLLAPQPEHAHLFDAASGQRL